MKAKLLVAMHMFLEKISGLFQKNNKKRAVQVKPWDCWYKKKKWGEDLAESFSFKI